MAGTKRPSYLKRQKEQKRQARALEKREARWKRKDENATDENAAEKAPLDLPAQPAE